MDVSGPRSYRMLSEMLASSIGALPDPTQKVVDIGRTWGAGMVEQPGEDQVLTAEEAVKRLMALLQQLGFSPQQLEGIGGRDRIGLRHCPFLELVGTQAQVICPLHLSLMQGAMEELGTPVTVDRLDPFAEPDLCVAHLTIQPRKT